MEHKLFIRKSPLLSLYEQISLFRKEGLSLHVILFTEPRDLSALSSTSVNYLFVLELGRDLDISQLGHTGTYTPILNHHCRTIFPVIHHSAHDEDFYFSTTCLATSNSQKDVEN